MHHSDVYAIASKDIVFESFDGEAVVLDLATGKYFGFTDTGSCLWEALSSGVSPENLVGATTGSGQLSVADLDAFVARLLEFGLLAPAAGQAAQPLSQALAAQLASAAEPAQVDIHDDLADLILVDPIHEVEEPQGWPAVKQAS